MMEETQKAGSPFGLPAFLFDIEKGEGKMVCVKSFKLLLDDFILQGSGTKVNRPEGDFTICLQPPGNAKVLFIKCLK